MRRLSLFTIVLSIILVAGCGVSKRTVYRDSPSPDPPPMMTVNSYNEIRASLIQAYHDWKGTPYRLGGASPSGVDCSSFIQIVFDDYFGIDLPGTTRRQMNKGNGIRRAALRSGDLVFFHTGRNTLHAGIMINEEEFLHASTSQGVMISSLFENYWAGRYLAARRIF